MSDAQSKPAAEVKGKQNSGAASAQVSPEQIEAGNKLLVAFKHQPMQYAPIREQTLKEPKPTRDPVITKALAEALANENWADVQKIFLAQDTAPEFKKEIRERVLSK